MGFFERRSNITSCLPRRPMVLIPEEIEDLPAARANMKSDKIKNWPVKERPRERLIAEGAEKQSDADLLAIILRVGRGTFTEGVLGQRGGG